MASAHRLSACSDNARCTPQESVTDRDAAATLPVCLSLASGWACRNLRADLTVADRATGNGGSGVYRGGAPLVGDFNGDGRLDVMQFQPQGWDLIPVCLNLGSGWSCRALHADYAGGLGPGNAGSGVY